jgi:hypothetical protein
MKHYVFLFADIVRYSELTNVEQLEVVQKLQLVSENTFPGSDLKEASKGIFIPTGDGLIAAFSEEIVAQNPHHVVEFASELERRLSPHRLRIGLHFGVAEQYCDFNARNFYEKKETLNNLAGADINLAQRVMSLGDAGNVLATKAFFDHYEHQRGHQAAIDNFHRLGVVKVKHGKELEVFAQISSQDPVPIPKRIKDYLTAQRALFSSLEQIHEEVKNASKAGKTSRIKTRVSLLLYDQLKKDLYVSPFRYGSGIDPANPTASRVRFALNEGPGKAFATNDIYHYELPPPPPATPPEIYVREFEKKSGIPREKILQFHRLGHFYLYFPLHHGFDTHAPYGVLSIDTMMPLWPRIDLEERLHSQRHLKRREISNAVDKEVKGQVKKLTARLKALFRHLGDAWTIINQYN